MTIELGNRLADLRKEHGYSQEELADKLGVSRQAVSKWERGEASPDTDNLIELAKIYDMSLDELLGLKESNKEEKKEYGEGVHISGGIHIKDGEDEVHISSEGIHIKDENGDGVDFSEGGIKIMENGEPKNVKINVVREGKHRVTALISLFTTFGVVIAYILLGSLLNLWGQAWTLFLLIPILPSFAEAIEKRNANIFVYPVFAAFVYLTLCAWILPAYNISLWHPLWVIFLTIPVYYGVCNTFKKH